MNTHEAIGMLGRADTAAELWAGSLASLLTAGHDVSPRGESTLEIENAVLQLRVGPTDEGTYCDPGTKVKTSRKYLFRELAWYLSGEQSPAMVADLAPLWLTIRSPNGNVHSNYGHHIFYRKPKARHKLTQWEWVVETLARDPWSRQAVIQIYDQQHQTVKNRDVPCTSAIQFRVRAGVVNMTVFMRSNDIRRGLTFDMPFFMFLQDQLARILQKRWQRPIERGTYAHMVGSLHLYANDFAWYSEQYGDDFGGFNPRRFQHGPDIPISDVVTPPYGDPARTIKRLLEASK